MSITKKNFGRRIRPVGLGCVLPIFIVVAALRVGMQRTHSEWHETPMGITLSDYLNQFGFGIKVDPSVEALVDDAISKPGSFYSRGRTRVVIVIPKVKRAAFAYAG
jgi:hypothetical protein